MWVAGNFITADILFLSVIVLCYEPNRSKITLPLCLLTFVQQNILWHNSKLNMRATNNLAHIDMPLLSIIAQYNQPKKSKKHQYFCLFLEFCTNRILCYIEKTGPAKIAAAEPLSLALQGNISMVWPQRLMVGPVPQWAPVQLCY